MRTIARMEPSPFSLATSTSICSGHFANPPALSGPGLGRWQRTVGLERKDRPEFSSVILPFVRWLSSNCV